MGLRRCRALGPGEPYPGPPVLESQFQSPFLGSLGRSGRELAVGDGVLPVQCDGRAAVHGPPLLVAGSAPSTCSLLLAPQGGWFCSFYFHNQVMPPPSCPALPEIAWAWEWATASLGAASSIITLQSATLYVDDEFQSWRLPTLSLGQP